MRAAGFAAGVVLLHWLLRRGWTFLISEFRSRKGHSIQQHSLPLVLNRELPDDEEGVWECRLCG